MGNKTYGYIRISTREQNTDRQRIALESFGVPAQNLFIDKQSGKDFERPQYQRLLKKIKTGDTLVTACRQSSLSKEESGHFFYFQ